RVRARGSLPLQDRQSPAELCAARRAAAEPRLQGMAVRWQCDVRSAELRCNRDTLVGALLNLVENAVQAAAGAVRLKIHFYSRGGALHICICDNRRGRDAATLSRLG